MKKTTCKLATLLLLGIFAIQSAYAQRNNILKVYNWADYIDEEVLAEFPERYKEQTGEEVEIIYEVFDINEIMLTKIERGHDDFDVVCPSEYIIQRMMRKDMLLPINRDFGNTPDYINNLSPYIQQELNKLNVDERNLTDYAVGYMWGTAGNLYNKEFVTLEEAATWESLWNEKYVNKILMKDSYRDAYGTAIIYANRDKLASGEVTLDQLMNDNSQEAINTAEEYLKAMKPNIAGWEADFGKEMMTKGKAWINFTWSGDAVWAIEEAEAVGVELDYVVPMEGSNVWFDGWVIPKYAQNTKAASYFINFMCRPDIALRNMDAIGYVSAIATPEILEAKIDPEIEGYYDLSYFFGEGADSIQIDPVQYPDRKVIERCAVIRDFTSKEDLEKALEMWSRVKGDNLNTGTLLIIGVVVLCIIGWVVMKQLNKRNNNKRKKTRR